LISLKISLVGKSLRDLKIGLEMYDCCVRGSPLLQALLLILLVAQYLLFLFGLTVKVFGKHLRYQAYSIKNSNKISNQFIALRAYKDKQFKLLKITGKQRLMN